MPEKIAKDQFVLAAIRKLRKGKTEDGKMYYGIHGVYSGFNKAFTEYYGEAPRETVDRMAKEGKIVVHTAKGGYSMYLAEDKPKLAITTEGILAKILG